MASAVNTSIMEVIILKDNYVAEDDNNEADSSVSTGTGMKSRNKRW